MKAAHDVENLMEQDILNPNCEDGILGLVSPQTTSRCFTNGNNMFDGNIIREQINGFHAEVFAK